MPISTVLFHDTTPAKSKNHSPCLAIPHERQNANPLSGKRRQIPQLPHRTASPPGEHGCPRYRRRQRQTHSRSHLDDHSPISSEPLADQYRPMKPLLLTDPRHRRRRGRHVRETPSQRCSVTLVSNENRRLPEHERPQLLHLLA